MKKRILLVLFLFGLILPSFSISPERVSWMYLKLDPDGYAHTWDPRPITLDSITIFDTFTKTYVHLAIDDDTSKIIFKAQIENDFMWADAYSSSWCFKVCADEPVGMRLIKKLASMSPHERAGGLELKNVTIQLYKIGYQKTWFIAIRDWN